jgi:hypothetical protein
VSFLFGLQGHRVVSHFSSALTFAAICVRDPPNLSFNPPLSLSSDILRRTQTEAKILTIPGGGAATPIDIALANLDIYGFNNVQKIPDIGGGAPVTDPVFITGLDGASNFTIVPLDATATKEFQDFIYVAIEEGTNNLLEISNFTKVLQIDNDQEMEEKLQQKYPGTPFEIIPGCFWKPCFELRSHLSVARRFRLENKEMFLLPNGNATDLLTESPIGGG